MSDFEAEIHDAELRATIAKIERRLPDEGRRAERDAAEAQASALRDAAPRRTGALAGSYGVEEIDGGTGAVSRHPGARLADEGGVVRAKGQALAIPFSSSGIARVKNAEAIGSLVVIKRDAGRSLLASVSAGRFEPHFTLIDQVSIRGTGYVARARQAAEKRIEAAAVAAAERAVR